METERGPLPVITYSKRTFAAVFKTDPELWSRFKWTCKARGVSICHVLEALMEAWIQGQKATATVIKPVVVNLTMQHVVKRPRRVATRGFEPWTEALEPYVNKYGSCRRLDPKGLYPGKIGWCRWLKQWIRGFECATCVHSGERH